MTSRTAHLQLLALALLGAALVSCTDAGRCERGEPECAPTLQGLCADGSEPVNDRCPTDGDVTPDGGGGSGGTPARVRPVWKDPGPAPDVSCSGTTVDALCSDFCEALCQNQERFCGDSTCETSDCGPNGGVFKACKDSCGQSASGDAAIECAQLLCDDQANADLSCEQFGFLDRESGVFETLCLLSDPACAPNPEHGCSQTCGQDDGVGAQLVGNERCEDGDTEDSVALLCPRGTDCKDCPPHPCTPAGEDCGNHGECCGFFGAGALCARSESADAYRCWSACAADGTCPDGFSCVDAPQVGMQVCVED